MFKWAIGFTLLLVGVAAAIAFWRTGVYKEVHFSSGSKGPLFLVYKEHVGPYHKILPTIETVETKLKGIGLPCDQSFGRFLNDPMTMDHDRLQSHGGCIFPSPISKVISQTNLKTEVLREREYLIATFNGSPSVGPVKVYPKAEQWFKKYGYKGTRPIIEIYKTLEDGSVLTTYLFPYE